MQLKENYDLVVLGDHVGGLLAAALATRLNLSVLVLSFGNSLKTFVSRQVQTDSQECLDPESNFLIGAASHNGEYGLLAHCLSHFDKWVEEESRVDFEKGLPQVLTPKNRFSLTYENDSFEREMNREFGNRVDSDLQLVSALRQAEVEYSQYWRNFLERLKIATDRSQKAARKELLRSLDRGAKQTGLNAVLQNLQNNNDFAEALLGLSYGIISHLPGADVKMRTLVEQVALARTGAGFKGGVSAFRDLLKKIAKKQGADFLADSQSSKIIEFHRLIVNDGRLTAVEVIESAAETAAAESEKKVHTLTVRAGAIGCSLAQLKEKVLIQKRSWLKKLKHSPIPIGWRFTVSLQVSRDAICPGMSERMVWKEKGAPPLEIETAFPSDYALADYGLATNREAHSRDNDSYRLIFLRTLVPYSAESLSPTYQEILAARMVRQLMKLVPFIDRHILKMFPDFRAPSFEADVLKVYPMRDLSEIPVNLCCYSKKGIGSDSGVDGLFIVSDEAYPELGSLGTTIASLQAMAWLAHQSGRSGPFG